MMLVAQIRGALSPIKAHGAANAWVLQEFPVCSVSRTRNAEPAVNSRVVGVCEVHKQPWRMPNVMFGFSSPTMSASSPVRFALQAPAGLDAIQLAVDVDLEQSGRVVGWAPAGSRLRALETQSYKVEYFNKHVYCATTDCLGQSTRPVAPGTTRFAFGPAHRCIGPYSAPATRCRIIVRTAYLEFPQSLDPLLLFRGAQPDVQTSRLVAAHRPGPSRSELS
jgi:hypothetical protein